MHDETDPVALGPILRWLARRRALRDFPLSDFDRIRDELKVCDVVLVEGRSRASDVIKLVTQSPWSHAALYIGRPGDLDLPDLRKMNAEQLGADCNEQLVVESELGLGTVIRPLSVYREEPLRICRPKGLNRNDARQVLTYALSRVGTPYIDRRSVRRGPFSDPAPRQTHRGHCAVVQAQSTVVHAEGLTTTRRISKSDTRFWI